MFQATMQGTVVRTPEPVGVPAGEWTHSMDMQVKTGIRGGRPYYETIYVIVREKDILGYPMFGDGEMSAIVTLGAIWVGMASDWAGQSRPCLCCTATTVNFVPRGVKAE